MPADLTGKYIGEIHTFNAKTYFLETSLFQHLFCNFPILNVLEEPKHLCAVDYCNTRNTSYKKQSNIYIYIYNFILDSL